MAGEIVKGRNTLERLREEITGTAKELNTNQERNLSLKTENGSIEKQINENKEKLTILIEQIERRQEELHGLDSSVIDAQESIATIGSSSASASMALIEAEQQSSSLIDEIASLELDRQSLLAEIEGRKILRDRMELDVRNLLGKKIALERSVLLSEESIRGANKKKEEVFVAIDTALENFKVFERRIAQFSIDTGYIVGYTRPDTLLTSK